MLLNQFVKVFLTVRNRSHAWQLDFGISRVPTFKIYDYLPQSPRAPASQPCPNQVFAKRCGFSTPNPDLSCIESEPLPKFKPKHLLREQLLAGPLANIG